MAKAAASKAALEMAEGYSIVRTRSAGIFAGSIKTKAHTVSGLTVEMENARRIWYWEGASSLSQMAVDGVSKPGACKFPVEVPFVELPEVIEILPCTKKAKESIASVEIWSS